MRWSERTHWLFDMDGTLTVAAHDFAGFKRQHGLPEDQAILESLALMPRDEAQLIHAALRRWETDIARETRPAAGAAELLGTLRERGCVLGVLTRNTREIAHLTLEAAGLHGFFDRRDVAGRDCAAPKPAPDGVLRQLSLWAAGPQQAVMVGDYVFDVFAGKAAGTATILVDEQGRFGEVPQADVIVGGLAEIADLLG